MAAGMASSISSGTGRGASSITLRWHAAAPAAVRGSYRVGDEAKAWRAWCRHLERRRRPVPPDKLVAGGPNALVWGFGNRPEIARCLGRIDEFLTRPAASGDESMLAAWLESDPPGDERAALESLAWCHALPILAARVESATWWAAVDRLATTAAEAARFSLDDQPLLHQLLAGELPLTLGYLFPELRVSASLLAQSRRALSAGLVEMLDQGIPHGRHFEVFRPLVACWTRCASMGRQIAKGCWSSRSASQYCWAVRQAINLTRADGGYPLDPMPPDGTIRAMFAAALELGGDDDDRWIAEQALPQPPKLAAAEPKSRRPAPSLHSEWAGLSVLRPTWSRPDPRLTAVYHLRDARMELEAARQSIFSGIWGLEVVRDGQVLAPSGDWAETCWVSDKDIDYLELEIDLGAGLRVERHMALAREDRFLLLADTVLSDRPAALEYRGSLPLADGIAAREAKETREIVLTAGRPAAVLLPLALPEWRVDPRVGQAGVSGSQLELRQSFHGTGLFAPWFIDLDPRRMSRPATWRQLTVAENRRILAADAAVGYRAMAGRRQWLIYRSLVKVGNRTVLGHNLVTEMLIARFGADGEIDPLIEIE